MPGLAGFYRTRQTKETQNHYRGFPKLVEDCREEFDMRKEALRYHCFLDVNCCLPCEATDVESLTFLTKFEALLSHAQPTSREPPEDIQI
uniref:Uncharacterized protein n=1 Tax=Heterorhabditis bacteriophora TaxID=37862 RepID=A0A1I7WFP6_HETBA